jgi:hypothetical protein
MMETSLDNRTAGVALVIGYLLLIFVLFRNPVEGFSAATATLSASILFVALPALGVASGIYTYFDGPFHAAVAFVTASYLGINGIALALLSPTGLGMTTGAGGLVVGLAVLALAGALRSTVRTFVPEV